MDAIAGRGLLRLCQQELLAHDQMIPQFRDSIEDGAKLSRSNCRCSAGHLDNRSIDRDRSDEASCCSDYSVSTHRPRLNLFPRCQVDTIETIPLCETRCVRMDHRRCKVRYAAQAQPSLALEKEPPWRARPLGLATN